MSSNVQAEEFYRAPKPLKYATSFGISVGNLVNTMVIAMIPPAITSFSIKYNTTVDKVSIIMNIMGVCGLCGALLAGFLFRYVNRHAAVVTFFTIEALIIASVPHMPNIASFYAMGGLSLVTTGIFNTAQLAWIIELWRHESGPFIQCQQFFAAMANIVTPLIMRPFLAGGNKENDETVISTTTEDTQDPESSASQLYIPFAITGALVLSMGALYQLILFIIYRHLRTRSDSVVSINSDSSSSSAEKTPPEEEHEEYLKSKSASRTKVQQIVIIALCAIFVGFCMTLDILTSSFLSLFAQFSEVKLTEAEASDVITAMGIGYAGGRLLGIFIVLKVPPHLILLANFTMAGIGNTILFTVGGSDETWLWIGCLIVGLGFSTSFPAFFAYLERYIVIDNTVSALFLVVVGGMMSGYPLIVGNSVQEHPQILNYCIYVNLAVMVGSFGMIFWLTYCKQRRNGEDKAEGVVADVEL